MHFFVRTFENVGFTQEEEEVSLASASSEL